MTLTVDIGSDVQAELARRAASHGMRIDAYAARLLEEAAKIPAELPQPAAKDMVELFAPLRGLDLNFERDRDAGRNVDL